MRVSQKSDLLLVWNGPNDGEVYDAPYEGYVVACTNNTIKNSVIKTGYPEADSIKIDENADHTTIDSVKVYASKNINPGQYATVINSNFYNASGIELGRNGVAYNNTVDGSCSKILNGANAYNNTFNSVTIGNVVFENNLVKNKLTITSPANVNNNNINSIELSSGSKYSNITNNIINGTITVAAVNVTIKFNNISTENDYAVNVTMKGAVVTNNMLFAKAKFGDNAVMRYQDSTVVEDNTPEPSLTLLQSQINKATADITLGQDFGYDSSITDIEEGIIITKDLKIIGNGYTIDGMGQARLFQINNGANVVIENVTFINGKAHGEEYHGNIHDVGGAITVNGHSNLTIINCSFTNNNAEQNGWGGSIFITGNSTLSIITSNFTDSDAQDGDVLYVLDGNYVHILECSVDGNNMADIDVNDIGDLIYNDKDDMGLMAPIKIFRTPDLKVNISNYTEGENAQIRVTAPSNFSGRASLNVDNKKVSDIQFNDEGVAYAQIDVTPGKVYDATLTNDYFEYARNIALNIAWVYVPTTTSTNSFKVMKKPNIQFDVRNITYGQIQTIKATINGTGNVTIKLNGVTIVDNIFIDKTVYCTVDDLNVGIYSIELNYSGDEFTVPDVAVFKFRVNKINLALSASSLTTVYNGGKYVVATLKDNAGKAISGVKVTVRFSNGKTDTQTTDKNGQVKFSTNGLAPVKTYTAAITFEGNAKYATSAKTVNVKVNKATPKIAAKAKTFKKSDKYKKYTIKLNVNQKVKVAINVNKRTYYAYTNANGQATFKLNKLAKNGKHIAIISSLSNKCYNKAKPVKVKITVK